MTTLRFASFFTAPPRPRRRGGPSVTIGILALFLAAAAPVQKRSAADTYLAYVDAVSGLRTIGDLKPFLPRAMTNMFGSMPKDLQNELTKQARNDAVARVKVVKESRVGGATILELTATRKDKPVKGWAKMVVEDGDFKLLKDDWSGAPAPAPPKIPQSVSESGRASGELTVKGKATPLKYAFARAIPGSPGQPRIEITLSDAPWKPGDPDPAERLRAGTLHLVTVTIGPDKAIAATTLSHRDLGSGVPGSAGSQQHFEPDKFGPDVVSGRLYMETPEETAGQTYYYAATFKAAIEK